MQRKRTPETQGDPRIEAYIDGLIEAGSQQRLPELFAGRQPNALYHIPDRHGVATVALRTPDLGEQQLVALLKYRLAQYLAVNMVDARMIYETGAEHEPRSSVSPDDVHLIAGSAESGEILCYAVFRALTGVPPDATLREQERPLFPVEQEFGWGIYNRLRILPDLPVTRVRELGRFMKNQRLHTLGPLGLRGPVEVGAAAMQLLLGPLRAEVEAVVGEIEEDVAGRNLAFFHAPIVVIHGAVPYVPEDAYLFAMYNYAARYPFAFLSSDLPAARSRLAAIEGALDLPGRQGLAALLALKDAGSPPGSSLEPPGGLAPLTTAEVPQRGVPMEVRRQLRVVGERLRRTDPFRDLSDAEATVLGTFMERREVEEGEVIIRQGEAGDDLFLIEAGRAEVRIRPFAGASLTLATFGPGDYFGEIALVTGSRRSADVVAVTPVRLMQLTRAAYARYLAQLTEVKYQVAQTAARRIGDTMQKLEEAPSNRMIAGHASIARQPPGRASSAPAELGRRSKVEGSGTEARGGGPQTSNLEPSTFNLQPRKEEAMSSSGERYLVNTVHSYSSGTVGRSLNTVGHHHFVIDSPTLGEEITSGDAFLAGISSCGVNLVERVAQELGVPVQRTEVTIEGLRDREAPSTFARIDLRFRLVGPTQEQAETLVGRYKDG